MSGHPGNWLTVIRLTDDEDLGGWEVNHRKRASLQNDRNGLILAVKEVDLRDNWGGEEVRDAGRKSEGDVVFTLARGGDERLRGEGGAVKGLGSESFEVDVERKDDAVGGLNDEFQGPRRDEFDGLKGIRTRYEFEGDLSRFAFEGGEFRGESDEQAIVARLDREGVVLGGGSGEVGRAKGVFEG